MNKKLIIDGNAVYEIDLDCLDCLDEQQEREEEEQHNRLKKNNHTAF